VIASARRTGRLEQMGFATVRADLADPVTHDPAFWAAHLQEVGYVVNAAGLLTASEALFDAVHSKAPKALYQAMPAGTRGLLISAIGIDTSETGFARHRRAGEALASDHDVTILRPGLVLADTSYGGSSLARALAALPLITPVVGDGTQAFNPIHADDLTDIIRDCLLRPPAPGPHEIGGPETVTQAEMLTMLRGWLGLTRARILPQPMGLARAMGRLGDALRLGPISLTAVQQLSGGATAKTGTWLDGRDCQPRGFSDFVKARPAGTQDLWQARLYLMRPLLRLVLGLMWLVSGIIGLSLPAGDFLPLIPSDILPDAALVGMARLGGLVDLAIGLALLRAWHLSVLVWVQVAMILTYTVAFTFLAPALWVLPLGGLLKNIPLLVLIALHGILESER